MKKKGLIISTLLILAIVTLSILIFSRDKKHVYAVYENGQMGIITSKINKKHDLILVENQELEVYQTFSNSINLYYESYNLDNRYDNTMIINDHHLLPLQASQNDFTKFIPNEISILGLNIVNGNLKLTFNSGTRLSDNYNTFALRNIYLKVGNTEIWSNEYPKSDYFNEPINFGEDDLNDDVRFNYHSTETLSFTIDKELLDVYGGILKDNYQKPEINVVCDDVEFILTNESALDISCNLTNGEVVTETKELQITKGKNINSMTVKMDGMPIPENLTFTKGVWSSGEHLLSIEATNKYGFKTTRVISFTLNYYQENLDNNVQYKVYQVGVAETLTDGIDNIGVHQITETTAKLDGDMLTTSYSAFPVINFVVEKDEKTSLIWIGRANIGRTVFMQIYNHDDQKWETVSTKMVLDNENITLGYDYLGLSKYLKDDLVYVRVSSTLNQLSNEKITHQIFHATDIQYINQMLTASGVDSSIGKAAIKALQSMVDYIIDQYQNHNMMYLFLTGDFVQQQKGVTIEEWETFQTYVLKPLLDAGIPLGVSSGNHDVGGVSSYNSTGVNTLDENLVYDYYSLYLGENVFSELEYYGESFQDNRSHYDLMTINNHEFMFLYLGWGSSIPGIHVSNQDIEWAKTILAKYPNSTVILATHEYMSNKGARSLTGEYVFQNLVKEYSNIKFVISGHINGSSKRIDAIDDNKDGINDRLVLQLLTDFQEEESLYGASFIRTIGLNFVDNVILFNQYSPYFKDSDIFVINNVEYVKDAQEFYYAFDLNNSGYGILTDYFG